MKLLAKMGLWGLLVGATGSALHADPVGGWSSPNGVSGAAGSGASTTSGSIGTVPAGSQAGNTAILSPADLQARTRQLHEQMQADVRHMQHLQQIARKEKDVIKLNCVNDKLVLAKPEMNIADAAEAELAGATDATRMASFGDVAQAAESIRQLREQADQCIGEAITQGNGESSNSFTGPKAPDDPTKGSPSGPLEPPGYASPFN
jgi:hypothetical protein